MIQFRQRLQPWVAWLKRVVTEPRSELTRWQRAARFTYDLGRAGARQLRQDKAAQMAAALAFRTLFSLVPVLVLGTILVRAFRGFEHFHARLEELMRSVGLDQVQVSTGTEGPEASQTLSQWLLDLVAQAETINLAAIGWVGLGVLIYSAIGLMVTIENSFNTVYRAPEGRSWTRRVPVYWTVLTLGPAALGLTVFANSQFSVWIESVGTWQWLIATGIVVWDFIVIWLVMLAIYKLVPNTSVELRPVMVGAFVAAVLLELGRRSLGAYLSNALSIRQLYGSLGLIPLFMFWVYLMWLLVLFGLEVAATLQMLGGRRLEIGQSKAPSSGLMDPASVLLIMELIAERFAAGETASTRQIAEAAHLPESTVAGVLERLVKEGLLHRLEQVDGGVILARPPDQIQADRLIELGYQLVDAGGPHRTSVLVDRLRAAQRSLASQVTLASAVSIDGEGGHVAAVKSAGADGR